MMTLSLRSGKLALLGVLLCRAITISEAAEAPGGEELKQLIPHLTAACAIVRENPSIWPFRSFPYGPLGLEARKANSKEADKIRNFYLGMAAAACQIPASQVTTAFFCGPDCPKNRRDHLVMQLPSLRAAVASFKQLKAVRLLSIWAPRGELRVNDVFVLDGVAREAIPSAKLGLVPSGVWKPRTSLGAYLATVNVSEREVNAIIDRMRTVGVSALINEASWTRVVGVGIADNESGLLFLRAGAAFPRVGELRPDGNEYKMLEQITSDVMYYETS